MALVARSEAYVRTIDLEATSVSSCRRRHLFGLTSPGSRLREVPFIHQIGKRLAVGTVRGAQQVVEALRRPPYTSENAVGGAVTLVHWTSFL